MTETIAIIEDDIDISDLMAEVLTGEGYEVLRAFSGTEALLLFERRQPDLVLLDLMLPGLSGEEVLRRTRDIPIIVVSAKAGIDHKVDVLLDGAVDYITKPFDTRELLARVAVQLRQREYVAARQKASDVGESLSGSIAANGIKRSDALNSSAVYDPVCDLSVDELSLEIICNGIPLKLTRTENAILRLLLDNPKRNLAKSVILDRIAADTPDCTEDSLKQHISHIRTKLELAGSKMKIESVWGIGYRLAEKQPGAINGEASVK